MDSRKLLAFLNLHLLLSIVPSIEGTPTSSKLFREYIGADGHNVTFLDVPINPNIDIHFILSFVIDDASLSSHPSPTNGVFKIFWDAKNLSPYHVTSVKAQNPNVKVALSLGGDTIGSHNVSFNPPLVDFWGRTGQLEHPELSKNTSQLQWPGKHLFR